MLLHPLAVPQKAHVQKTGGHRVDLLHHLVDVGHGVVVVQHQGHPVRLQHLHQFGPQPLGIAHLHRQTELVGGHPFQKSVQPADEPGPGLVLLRVLPAGHVPELHQQRPQPLAQRPNRPQERLHLAQTVDQLLLVRDHPRHLGREPEVLGRPSKPPLHHAARRNPVPGRVYLDHLKNPGIVLQVVLRRAPRRIDQPFPILVGPAGRPQKQPLRQPLLHLPQPLHVLQLRSGHQLGEQVLLLGHRRDLLFSKYPDDQIETKPSENF